MTTDNRSREELLSENKELRISLEEAEETLTAIRSGAVDALVVSGANGEQIFTLQGAESPYRMLVESMNEGAATLTRDGAIIYCNKCLAAMLQISLEKLIGTRLVSYVAPVDQPVFAARLERYAEEPNEVEVSLIAANGELLPGLFSCCAMEHSGRVEIGVVITDIRPLKQAEALAREVQLQAMMARERELAAEVLREAHAELEQRVAERTHELALTIDRMKTETGERLRAVEELREKEQMLVHQSRLAAMGEMINNIAHQWRQPLNTLGLLIQQNQLLCQLGELNQEIQEDSCSKSMELIQHMSRTIDDFRDFFRPDKEKADFRVRDELTRTISLLMGSLSSHHIRIEVDEIGEPVIHGYSNEFCQVLLNILMNARDALTERNIKDPTIRVSIGNNESRVVVTIVDNAGGIPIEIIDRIFDPYFTTKQQANGTGVGLFMSKTIIEKNMGGKLTARNTGMGAEFRIEV